MIEKPAKVAIIRREVRDGRLRMIGEEVQLERCEGNERWEWLASFERFIC